MIHKQRFVVAEIAIGQAEHQSIAQGSESLARVELRNAPGGAREWRHLDMNRPGQGRIVWDAPVHMEFQKPQLLTTVIDVHEKVWRAIRRRRIPIEVGG